MSGAGEADRGVWQEFFDGNPSELRIDALSKEFARLWGDAQLDQSRPPEASETASIITDEAERLEGLTLEQLQSRCAQRETLKLDRPGIRILSAKVFDRDPLIIALAKKRAANKCEVPDCTHPSFETAQGTRYTEVHHIVPLADGGEDRAENVACLCPAHHREVHLGVRGQEINTQLLSLRTHS
jgi:5-methylcytosine-specific restriction endonuclease McrA